MISPRAANPTLAARHLFRYNGQAIRKGRRSRGYSSILRRKEVRPMPVVLPVSIVIAALILLYWLRAIEAEVKKAARDDEDHKR